MKGRIDAISVDKIRSRLFFIVGILGIACYYMYQSGNTDIAISIGITIVMVLGYAFYIQKQG